MALKYEYGAKFGLPFLLIVEIQPIGLGKMSDLYGSIINGCPFLGS